MLRKLFTILKGRNQPPSQNAQPHGAELVRFRHGVYEANAGNEDVLAGYVFTATLDPWTPLNALRQHGAVVRSLPTVDQRTSARDGVWLPKPKSFKELGLSGLRELPTQTTMASAIGYVPEDGGSFLPF